MALSGDASFFAGGLISDVENSVALPVLYHYILLDSEDNASVGFEGP